MVVGFMIMKKSMGVGDGVKKSLQCGEKLLEFEVVRSRRRTLAITVEPSERVMVRAPLSLPPQKILELVEQKADWIVSKLLFWQEAQRKKREQESAQGKSLLYLGEYYRLQTTTMAGLKRDKVQLADGKIIVTVGEETPQRVEKALKKWYYERAQEFVERRVAYYGRFFRKTPLAIRVKEQKKRWGSCTFDNKLLFNWRCIMATEQAFDYVIVHELCHMPHKNHSRSFWEAVEAILPEYRLQKKWLKENGINMDL